MSSADFLAVRTVAGAGPNALASPERAGVKSQLRAAAEGFEAILVRRLLESARAGSFAGDSPFSGPGVEQFETMLGDRFADLAASRGAFGIADAIERQLASGAGRPSPGEQG